MRVLARRDRFDRFVSVLVYVPRERYDSAIRVRIGDYLAASSLSAASPPSIRSSQKAPLVARHFIIGRSGGATPGSARNARTGNRRHRPHRGPTAVGAAAGSWPTQPARRANCSPATARPSLPAIPDVYSPSVAAGDVRVIETLNEHRPLGVDFHHRLEEEQREIGLKVWSLRRPLPLSERVPVLENMGFRVVDERTYHIEPVDWPERLVSRHAAGTRRRRGHRSRADRPGCGWSASPSLMAAR